MLGHIFSCAVRFWIEVNCVLKFYLKKALKKRIKQNRKEFGNKKKEKGERTSQPSFSPRPSRDSRPRPRRALSFSLPSPAAGPSSPSLAVTRARTSASLPRYPSSPHGTEPNGTRRQSPRQSRLPRNLPFDVVLNPIKASSFAPHSVFPARRENRALAASGIVFRISPSEVSSAAAAHPPRSLSARANHLGGFASSPSTSWCFPFAKRCSESRSPSLPSSLEPPHAPELVTAG